MLKTTKPLEKSTSDKLEFGDSEGGDDISNVEIAKKFGKSKNQKLSKSRKLAMSKKPSKSGNLPNFDAKDSGPSFLTPKARVAFNCLWLTFTKALILRHFDPKWHIWIETDVSGYAIGNMLSQLASGTSPDGVITKTDLSQ